MDDQNRVSLTEMLATGLAAWLVLNVTAYVAAWLMGIPVSPAARFLGSFLFPGAGEAVQLWTGRALFLAAALGWSLFYPRAARHLPGPGWLRGAIFGAGIWLVTGLVLPLIGAVHPGAGRLFAADPATAGLPFPGLLGIGFAGIPGIVLSVLAHQAFGITLGALTALQENQA